MEHHNIPSHSPLMMLLSFICSIALIINAKLLVSYNTLHIPPIIIEILQCLSYGGSFALFVLTAYKFHKGRKKSK